MVNGREMVLKGKGGRSPPPGSPRGAGQPWGCLAQPGATLPWQCRSCWLRRLPAGALGRAGAERNVRMNIALACRAVSTMSAKCHPRQNGGGHGRGWSRSQPGLIAFSRQNHPPKIPTLNRHPSPAAWHSSAEPCCKMPPEHKLLLDINHTTPHPPLPR